MKTRLRILQWLIMLILSASALGTWAQTSITTTQSVCAGNQPYKVDPISGATFVWNITGGVDLTDYHINGSGNSISVDWDSTGIYVVSVYSYIVESCPSSTQTDTVTVVDQPIGPTIYEKSPPDASVCAGIEVSATFSPGSGGVGCSDVFEYKHNSGSWLPYISGTSLSTATYTSVEIRGQRSGCTSGAGCTETPWDTLASWIVNPNLPVSVSIANQNNVCAGTLVTFTATPTNGGTGPVYVWHVNTTLQPDQAEPIFIYTPVNGNQIYATLTSNATCATGNPATSGTVTMIINTIPTTSAIWHN